MKLADMTNERLWAEHQVLGCLEPRWDDERPWPDKKEIYDAIAGHMLTVLAQKMDADSPSVPAVRFHASDVNIAQYDWRKHEISLSPNWRPHSIGMTILAHEMVHAIQYHRNPRIFEQMYSDAIEKVNGNPIHADRLFDSCVKVEEEAFAISAKWDRGPLPIHSASDARAFAEAQCGILTK